MAQDGEKVAFATIPRNNSNEYPAPYGTHDNTWISHYPDALDQLHATANDGDGEIPEPSVTPPPVKPPPTPSGKIESDSRCIFCQIVAGKRPSYQVYRDSHCMAFLDLFPLTEGQ